MISQYLVERFIQHLPFTPNPHQEHLIQLLVDFSVEAIPGQLMILKGYAGTGKTSMVSAFANTLKEMGIQTVLLAPTGRAAKVFGGYAHEKAYTIHKQIYRRRTAKDAFSPFVLGFNKCSSTLFIVDEASMIGDTSSENAAFGSGNVLDDLFAYVYNNKGCRLMLVGDTAQLPPVGIEQSPALNVSFMERYHKEMVSYELTEVVRQQKEADLLFNATRLRVLVAQQKCGFPSFRLNQGSDMIRLKGSELMEQLSDSYDKVGIEETLVVCRSNLRANKYNEGIRAQILFREEEIASNDYMMVVKNNYYWAESTGHAQDIGFIANGDILKICRIRKYVERYGFHFAEVEIELPDYDHIHLDTLILLDVLHTTQASMSGEDQKKLYYTVLEDYAQLTRGKQREAMRVNPFFNALQVKFAYAVTCHKSQGGQWKHVFVDQGWFSADPPDLSYLRWLYTAITRATEQVYLVNFKDEFFEEHL